MNEDFLMCTRGHPMVHDKFPYPSVVVDTVSLNVARALTECLNEAFPMTFHISLNIFAHLMTNLQILKNSQAILTLTLLHVYWSAHIFSFFLFFSFSFITKKTRYITVHDISLHDNRKIINAHDSFRLWVCCTSFIPFESHLPSGWR